MASQLPEEEEVLQSPLSQTDTLSSSGGTFSDLSSATERLTMMESTPFVVTEDLSKRYYKGLPSNPPLIATTKPGPFEPPSGLEAYSVLKELRGLGDHPLASIWERGVAIGLRRVLNTMTVNWTSIEALRIVEAGESSSQATVWIGVDFGALSFKEGSVVAHKCRAYIDSYGIHDYQVEIRESRVMRSGNRFLNPVPLSDPTFTARNPYTATLGIPISAKDRPWTEGTGGFYLSAGGNDKDIYLVTARHVVLPLDTDDNKEYERRNDSKAREDVVILGTSGFNEKLAAIDYEIMGRQFAIADAEERIQSVEGKVDPTSEAERRDAGQDLQKAKVGCEALETFRHYIATHWEAKEQRIFGELAWAPPIVFSTEPGMYTMDLAVIKIDSGMLDAHNYIGNAIGIGNKYTRQEFMNKVYLHPASPTSFEFPADRLVKLQGQVPESALSKPPMIDAAGESCLIVFKNGAETDTTIGKANNVSSYTRTYFAGRYVESREWSVINKGSGAFSAKGDSGSCVADIFNRVGGILTGGCGATESSDVTYVTPISFIMKVLRDNKRFKNAHLNPVLA
jgi:hypothetical protein